MKFKVWSNILFFVPIYLSILSNVYWYTFVICFSLLFSTVFHLANEKKFRKIDKVTSLSLITSNFILLFAGRLKMPHSFIAISFAIVAIIFYQRQSKYGYNFNHGMWHIFSAVVCYFSLLSFI